MTPCPACAQMYAWHGAAAADYIPAWHHCQRDTVAIRGVWLVMDGESAGRAVHVVVELADGSHRTVISESWPGPVSHFVHPPGIRQAAEVTW